MGSPWNWQKGKGQSFNYQQYPKGGFQKGGGAHTGAFSPAGSWRKGGGGGGGGQSWGGGWQNTNDKIEMLGSVVENIGSVMEYEQWMKSEKEWKEAELKKEEEQALLEAATQQATVQLYSCTQVHVQL